jgi:cytoskeletal protein CcmA (bactofilin family)
MPWGIFDKKPADTSEWSGFLEQGTKFEGKLESPGTLRLDTQFNGSIISQATLILGEHARGKGDLSATNIVVAGQFDGIIHVRQRVELQPKSVVTGEIHAPNLAIEPGAIFDGSCHVTASKEPDKPIVVRIRSGPQIE